MKKILIASLMLLCWLGGATHAAEEKMLVPDLTKIKVIDLPTAQFLALAGNPSIEASQARVEQARARVKQAAAAWWPSLNLSVSASRIKISDTSFEQNRGFVAPLGSSLPFGTSIDQTTDRYTGGIQATWKLFDGFQRTFREQEATYDEQSVGAAWINNRRLLVSSVAEAFLNTQLAQTKIAIARADEAFYIRQLEDAQNRYTVGAGPWGDVLNIKVQLNTARTELMLYQREFEANRYGLAGLLGLPDATFPDHIQLAPLDKDTRIEGGQKTPDVLITEALAARPDIRQLELVIKQAQAAQGTAKSSFYPQVQATGTIEGAREGGGGLDTDDFGSTVGINMNWNLYAGGGDKARLIEAEQAKREAVYTLADLRNSVAAEIRQSLALLAAAQEQVTLQRETVKLVQENRDLAENEYEAGEASLVRLNEAQRDLNATSGRLAQALVSYHLAMQQLLSATGQNLAAFDLRLLRLIQS